MDIESLGKSAANRVLILGCGWVGEEFANAMKLRGNEVWVTTTTEEKKLRLSEQGFQSVLLDFDSKVVLDGFDIPITFDFVLNSIPASSRNSQEVLLERFNCIKLLLEQLTFRKHIYLSSIGIYPDADGLFDENWQDHLDERLLLAEQTMQQADNTLIYRLGGLFGKSRIFAKYFSGKVCRTGNQPANFVHLADVVKLLVLGFERLRVGEIFNIVAPEHPKKKAVILASAAKYGYAGPSAFESTFNFQKIVSGQKIIDELQYHYKYPSPLKF